MFVYAVTSYMAGVFIVVLYLVVKRITGSGSNSYRAADNAHAGNFQCAKRTAQRINSGN